MRGNSLFDYLPSRYNEAITEPLQEDVDHTFHIEPKSELRFLHNYVIESELKMPDKELQGAKEHQSGWTLLPAHVYARKNKCRIIETRRKVFSKNN